MQHCPRQPALWYHPAVTPIRRQYLDVKRRFPHAIVFFRLGDFYETFDDDARLCARELDLVLTSRPLGKDARVPMAGIPFHAVNSYLARLIARGHRVAICDQIGEPSPGRGLVERKVTRVITPGTVLTDDLLRGTQANYLAALIPNGRSAGLAWVDVSTGEFVTAEIPADALPAELARIQPAELLMPDGTDPPEGCDATLSVADERCGEVEWSSQRLMEHFGVASLEAFGCARLSGAVCAAAAVLVYLQDTQPAAVAHVTGLRTHDTDSVMVLDAQTRRNLELFEGARGAGRAGTLLSAVDRTRTALGARLLRARLGQPLRDVEAINRRLGAVESFVGEGVNRVAVRERLGRIPDLERLLGRTVAGAASPRDLLGLHRGLAEVGALREQLGCSPSLPAIPACDDAAALIAAAIAEDAPASLDQGGVIRGGFSEEMDGLRALSRDARAVLAEMERAERERTGIRSLKVGYNRVFGYYIEVSHVHAALVPDDYQRRQTLTGAERYVTPELKEYESRVLGAQERIAALESDLFRRVCTEVAAHAPVIRTAAAAIAEIDVASALAEIAVEQRYCRPAIDDGERISIRAGRHPVVEQTLPPDSFVPNDTELSADEQIIVLTGPNMAGKSTYLRQVAQIVLLAQAGCFVPAEQARIGLVDRIFTRIGAQDDLAAGNSTFMVEMVETAQILHHATRRSLVILDEVGRGTSTYDGLSIARAVVEHLHNRREAAARTLFATHYHELTSLARSLPRVRNASVAVAEQDGEVVFLRRIVPGGADRSYGIHVAQLAGLPRAVVHRATELLSELEAKGANGSRPAKRRGPPPEQMPLFGVRDPLLDELASLDIDALTPLEALTRLYELRERARGANR
jgi:DNA mismatch repair protein MutS